MFFINKPIDQKAEEKLQRELKRIGVSFRIWEERGDDKLNTKVKKWSQPTGIRKCLGVLHLVQINHVNYQALNLYGYLHLMNF